MDKIRLYWRHPVYCFRCKVENKLYLHRSFIKKDCIDDVDELAPFYESHGDSIIWTSGESFFCDKKYHEVSFTCNNKHCVVYDIPQRFEIAYNAFSHGANDFGYLIKDLISPVPYGDIDSIKVCAGGGYLHVVYFFKNGKEEVRLSVGEIKPFDIETSEVEFDNC